MAVPRAVQHSTDFELQFGGGLKGKYINNGLYPNIGVQKETKGWLKMF